ncbi:zinc-ribbon domain-containing protein [Oribacterium sp. P6A1]|uniref:zinc-ribbon domain-containing protein n=1 Tax=Oribacterium sp. P6A1 TaxID=1410612 RepID=UPI000568AE83|nr:zinc-ribbon domain-containing protein [Oribacterium sp. P6A1]
MICKKCGAEIRDGAQFCGKCGTCVSETINPVQATEKRSGVAFIWIVVCALVVVACGIGAFLYFDGQSKPDTSEDIIDIWYKLNNDTVTDDIKARFDFVNRKDTLKPRFGTSNEVVEKYKELVKRAENENWNTDTGYFVLVLDNSDLLTINEEEGIKKAMIPVTKYGNAVFITTDDNSSSASDFAENTYFNLMGIDSGALFLIDMNNKEIYMHMDGKIYKEIGIEGAGRIIDSAYISADKGEYFTCGEKAFELVLEELEN